MRWEPPPSTPAAPFPVPSFWTAVRRGLSNRCPVCGEGRVFAGFLRVAPECGACHAPLGRLRADDARDVPALLIARTVKGKGVSFMESELGWHLGYLEVEDEARALAELREGA